MSAHKPLIGHKPLAQAVVWDWNGTLLDDVDACIAAMNELIARRGLPELSQERYREAFTFPVQTYYEILGFDFGSEAFQDVAVEFHVAYESRVDATSLHADAIAALNSVRGAGVDQAILSALEEGRLVTQLQRRGIADLFAHVCGLGDIEATGKIDRGRELLDLLHCDYRYVWMIGDTSHDAEVAEALGIRCVLVTIGHHDRRRLAATGRHVVDTLVEAVDLILAEEG